MKISHRRLLDEAQATGFRSEVLEKVIQLMNLLLGFTSLEQEFRSDHP